MGPRIRYAVQPKPEGLAQAFLIGREFIGDDDCALVLGDNIFFGHYIREDLKRAASHASGATVFGYQVSDPERYGVVEFDEGRAISIEEKPKRPKSSYAVTGLYFYDNQVVDIAAAIEPSWRGELEITDVNRATSSEGQLRVERWAGASPGSTPGRTTACSRRPSTSNLHQRQGLQIACPEEIAYRLGHIDAAQLQRLAEPLLKTDYGRYLVRILDEQGPRDWAGLQPRPTRGPRWAARPRAQPLALTACRRATAAWAACRIPELAPSLAERDRVIQTICQHEAALRASASRDSGCSARSRAAARARTVTSTS